MDLPRRLLETFGKEEVPLCLFYNFTYSLRFELGGEVHGMDDPVPRFLQAIDRARAVAHDLFDNSSRLDLVLSIHASRMIGKRERSEIGGLAHSGFDVDRLRPLAISSGRNDKLYRHWYGCELAAPKTDIDRLLWCAVAKEMPISPKARLDIYLLDWTRRLILHVYDDRGMDVAAMTIDPLRPLYRRFGPWLLEFDRVRMDGIFSASIDHDEHSDFRD